ncbi:hypothetical protein IW261DRAFT_1621298 [Armillaria novae-zelandiae]|uniref:Uncharacterized protein n=1 Tax=Armillaria novae-zelandiae TaxID=153914 RepID=A0AA39PVZ7_9AGAR|nr:hypothetical protein IW261DRAFT_1621298 [Armillaria novae-zelandiae]
MATTPIRLKKRQGAIAFLTINKGLNVKLLQHDQLGSAAYKNEHSNPYHSPSVLCPRERSPGTLQQPWLPPRQKSSPQKTSRLDLAVSCSSQAIFSSSDATPIDPTTTSDHHANTSATATANVPLLRHNLGSVEFSTYTTTFTPLKTFFELTTRINDHDNIHALLSFNRANYEYYCSLSNVRCKKPFSYRRMYFVHLNATRSFESNAEVGPATTYSETSSVDITNPFDGENHVGTSSYPSERARLVPELPNRPVDSLSRSMSQSSRRAYEEEIARLRQEVLSQENRARYMDEQLELTHMGSPPPSYRSSFRSAVSRVSSSSPPSITFARD